MGTTVASAPLGRPTLGRALWLVMLTIGLAAMALSPRQLSAQEAKPDKRSGTTFLSPDLQAQQRDDGANPGMLWVDVGAKHWAEVPGGGGKSCEGCHANATQSMAGVSARYPRIDASTGGLRNLELQINHCRTTRQSRPALAYESNELLSLTAYVAAQSRGRPINVTIDGPARPHFEAGRTFFMSRQGQLNVSCSQCHDDNVGRRLRGDTITPGHPTGFPIYRLEWQSVGSLHRRLRACSLGVRAEVLDFASPEYLALELYLAARAQGMTIETPAIRR